MFFWACAIIIKQYLFYILIFTGFLKSYLVSLYLGNMFGQILKDLKTSLLTYIYNNQEKTSDPREIDKKRLRYFPTVRNDSLTMTYVIRDDLRRPRRSAFTAKILIFYWS